MSRCCDCGAVISDRQYVEWQTEEKDIVESIGRIYRERKGGLLGTAQVRCMLPAAVPACRSEALLSVSGALPLVAAACGRRVQREAKA
jgi:hypothetical protein